jgi:hypothetical protein
VQLVHLFPSLGSLRNLAFEGGRVYSSILDALTPVPNSPYPTCACPLLERLEFNGVESVSALKISPIIQLRAAISGEEPASGIVRVRKVRVRGCGPTADDLVEPYLRWVRAEKDIRRNADDVEWSWKISSSNISELYHSLHTRQ